MYKNGKKIATMYPERRFYKASQQTSTIVANRSRLNEDLYLVYTGKNPDTGRPIIKAHVNPLVLWIWIGVHLLLIGTIIALLPNAKPKKLAFEKKEREAAEAASGAVGVAEIEESCQFVQKKTERLRSARRAAVCRERSRNRSRRCARDDKSNWRRARIEML